MSAIAEKQDSHIVHNAPTRMLELAIEKGAGLEQLQQLMDLQERWEQNEARKAYVRAMAAFKADPPAVRKDRTVSYSGTHYTHASLAQVCDAAVSGLAAHGLSHRWDTRQDGNTISVTCVITHELGYSEDTTLSAAPDGSGKKNPIQQIASTVTYLERYTLMAALGLASKDMDDDAATAVASSVRTCTQEEAADLKDMIRALPKDKQQHVAVALADTYKVRSVDELTPEAYKSLRNRVSLSLDESNA